MTLNEMIFKRKSCRSFTNIPVDAATIETIRAFPMKPLYPDLMEEYENPIQHACDVAEGQVWIAGGWAKPEGFCDSAWDSISAFVMTLAHGSGNFYDGWMKNPKSAMISCNDGFRPVSFYLEALDEEAEG